MPVKYLLAILNSRLISFWYSNYFNSLKMAGGYLNFSSRELEVIPIMISAPKIRHDIINFVDKILLITKTEDYPENIQKQMKVRNIENQIDKLIYKLYGLTEDEIKIVEAKL